MTEEPDICLLCHKAATDDNSMLFETDIIDEEELGKPMSFTIRIHMTCLKGMPNKREILMSTYDKVSV